mgnify:CR=1 FL=1
MTKFRFLTAGAWAALASALALTSLPAAAQDERRDGGWGSREARAERRAERRAQPQSQAQAQPQAAARGAWAQQREARAARPEPRADRGHRADRGDRGDRGSWAQPRDRGAAMPGVRAGAGATVATDSAPRDRSYGAYTRGRDWAAQRQARDAAAAQQRGEQQRPGGTWARSQDRADWQRDRSYGATSTDRRHDRRQDARAERRDDNRNYNSGYRDGRRDDNRWGQNHRRWDNRGWRNDHRYDWYRHRSANRSLFRLGRYYAPHRGYSYSRVSIGFRLGSPFYSNRYWINDPWRYRLPDVYGPYRWVRYYDDALLVDIYSGEVVDVIHNFFW